MAAAAASPFEDSAAGGVISKALHSSASPGAIESFLASDGGEATTEQRRPMAIAGMTHSMDIGRSSPVTERPSSF